MWRKDSLTVWVGLIINPTGTDHEQWSDFHSSQIDSRAKFITQNIFCQLPVSESFVFVCSILVGRSQSLSLLNSSSSRIVTFNGVVERKVYCYKNFFKHVFEHDSDVSSTTAET